jgi:hypothetical protein
MTTLKEILGTSIKSVASDPSNPTNGEIWYNTTSNNFKAAEASTSGTWTAGGNLGTGRNSLAGAGTQTAGLAFGGFDEFVTSNSTEEYNGTSWTAGGNLGTGRGSLAGAGTQTAGLAFGNDSATEQYDGSAWTAGGNLGTGRNTLAGAGTQTAGLAFGGGFPGTNSTEEYTGPGAIIVRTITTS